MAYYFLTASKDASIYLQQPFQNTGLDEILEVSKVYYGNIKDVSRALIKFDFDVVSEFISGGKIELDEVRLLLKETESNEIPLRYTVFAHPISGSWEMGIGSRFDNITTAGAVWRYREGDSRLDWFGGIGEFETGSDGTEDGRGGVWYTSVSASQHFEYQTADINMDVAEVVESWISGTLPNYGFILKYPTDNEGFVDLSGDGDFDTNDYGQLKFFSKETNTIYQPKVRFGWNDQIFETGSLQPLQSENPVIRIKNLKTEYKVNTTTVFRVVGRDKFPLKTFTNKFPHGNTSNYLPMETYYQIRDFLSNDVIIPFGEYSKISCNESGNFILLNFTNWEVDRVYKIDFKIVVDEIEHYFDNNYTFKLIK
jgi:hypothetical protein